MFWTFIGRKRTCIRTSQGVTGPFAYRLFAYVMSRFAYVMSRFAYVQYVSSPTIHMSKL